MDVKVMGKGQTLPDVGFPGVVLSRPKFGHNVGAVVRAASCFGVRQVVWTGDRVSLESTKGNRLPREERMRAYTQGESKVEMVQSEYPIDLFGECVPVAVEVRDNSELLPTFEHPENAVYVFGPEDGSVQQGLLPMCHRFVVIPTLHCVNLSAAVYMVLYDRMVKAGGPFVTPGVNEQRGFVANAPVEGLV